MCELYTPIFRAVFVQPKLARQKKSETTPPPTTVLTRETHLNTVFTLSIRPVLSKIPIVITNYQKS